MSAPYTLVFGAWAPDLQNVGLQYQWSQAGMNVPVADLLNCYYADAAYRCMPGTVSIGPSLGAPALNAVTWYDNSTGTEDVFAATASSMYLLTSGSWNQVPIQFNSSSSSTGVFVQVVIGSPLVASISPSSLAASGKSASSILASQTVQAPSLATKVWSLASASGGTWSVYSGQGSSQASAQVSGVAPGVTATATFNCQVTYNGITTNLSASLSYGYMTGSVSGNASGNGGGTVTTNTVTASESGGVGPITYAWSAPAGATATAPNSATTAFSASSSISGIATCTIVDANGTSVQPTCAVNINTGYTGTLIAGSATVGSNSYAGYFPAYSIGSLSPTTDAKGNPIGSLTDFSTLSSAGFELSIYGFTSDPGQSYFSQLNINSTGYTSASAAYTYSGGNATWQWNAFPFTDGNTYTITIVY